MTSSIKALANSFRIYPLRGVLTVVTIAIGVGALVITFSLSFDVNAALERSLSAEGRRIVIANGTLNEAGTLSPQRPSRFAANVADILQTEYGNLRDVTRVSTARWTRVSANGTSYQVRSATAAGPNYASLMDLDLIAGSFYTEEDAKARRPVVVISESTARILFGGAGAAVGQQVLSALPSVAGGGTGGGFAVRMRMSQEPFTVVGVFRDVSELSRQAFGVGDFIIPIELNLPVGMPVAFDPEAVVMARVVSDSVERATSVLGTIVEHEYGDGTRLAVWEGSPQGPRPLIEESRRSVRSFALTINVLGVIILIASSIGIFSIMLVEVLNRTREIGLRRALGSTRAGIRRFFLSQALYFSVLGSALGTALAFVFYGVVGASLAPFFEASGLSLPEVDLTTPGIAPILLAAGTAVVVGSLFGLFPAISASRTPIVDCIREEAA